MRTLLTKGAIVTVAAVLSIAATGAAPAVSSSGDVPALPKPTGPHVVGMTVLHLVDDTRPDPWVAKVGKRELMVSLWYPAKAPTGRRALYMTPVESELLLKGQQITGVPLDMLSRTRTNAFVDAEPHGRGLPLVVLSPGFTMPRGWLTSLSEELASKGYVVAAVDHTYESYGTSLPGGRTATCAACDSARSPGFGAKATKGRAADVSFVLDRLTGSSPAWKSAKVIDPARIGMVGYSMGGSSAQWTMLNDSRVRAGVNMDGPFFVPIPKKFSRPFLMMGAEKVREPGGQDTSWDRDWRRMTGWKRWLTLAGSDHGSFTDFPMLTEQDTPASAGALPGARGVEIIRKYTSAFLDQHLRQRRQPLLDGPSPRYPEAVFHH
ncbi:alpha/beta hydrolase family protein [Streptosporangium carneum]|uniref:Lipase n=1 Tax=Streptosporangium carneum TaxID=47481 RepID=A0A9W6MF30_9ACTN|nr:alpha/beta hydrolase [Streptosporangium carneum]GLK11443.1 lipase [Streptosporangium carneum]